MEEMVKNNIPFVNARNIAMGDPASLHAILFIRKIKTQVCTGYRDKMIKTAID